ncbi:MAG: DUF4835 family protein [Bacteroidales bacterium]|jgi:hypothetical protein|nr:DUF4835 family protein [Bacteroidales bacterium]
MKRLLIFIVTLSLTAATFAQELLCRVSVSTVNMKGTGSNAVDKSIFTALEQNLTSFMNDRKWSEYNFKTEEKIECSIQLVIENASGNDMYEGKIYVNLSRPVYNSSYNSPLLLYQDNYLKFKYTTAQPFDYDENSYLWTVTSIMAYYANLFLGITFDSYASNGGTSFYNKCINIISNAPQTESGWLNTTKEKRNRYWLLESFTNPSYGALRKFIYQYHQEGMDIMSQSTTKGVEVILSALEILQNMNNTYPGNTGVAIICITKASEFVNVFSGATMEEKQKASDILKRMDPSNMEKYEKMTK